MAVMGITCTVPRIIARTTSKAGSGKDCVVFFSIFERTLSPINIETESHITGND